MPAMVMNAGELSKALSDNNFFHLDTKQRLAHPFFDRHKLPYMGSQH